MYERKSPKEKELAQDPAAFQEIFGGAQFPMQSVRKLLAAVALVHVEDYFKNPDKVRDPKVKSSILRARTEAERYIFDQDYLPKGNVFSFHEICRVLGVTSDYARKGIRSRTSDELRGIIQQVASGRGDV